MNEKKNIKNYSVTDFEKYWKGQLTHSEMHDLEKAAMDDPFLADALEGYKNSILPAEEINQLRQTLAERISSKAKVLPIKKKSLGWLRVAAAIILLAGLGIAAEQMIFINKDKSISQLNKEVQPDIKPVLINADTLKESLAEKLKPDSLVYEKANLASKGIERNNETKTVTNDTVAYQFSDIKTTSEKSESIASAAPRVIELKKEEKKENVELPGNQKINDDRLSESISVSNNKREGIFNENNNAYFNLSNKYNYKVVDEQNNPVPFANVFNTQDNVGTYTDIKGMFNLISSDTVMNVQIKSLGYNLKNYKLVPAITTGRLTLEEDAKARSEILANTKKVVSSRSREENAELEEPEVGWDNYNTYVLNNIKIPDNIPIKETNNVELSFQVDKDGNPINIAVTKSSNCKACDDAAVKVIKEGPKWSRKGKKSKATVSIAIDK